MKPLHGSSVSLFDKLGRDGVRYLGAVALGWKKHGATPPLAPKHAPGPHSVGESLLEALSSGAPRLRGRG